MATIKVFGNAVVITSALKAEDIKLAAKYQPEALILKDKNDVPFFGVGTTTGTGSITDSGVYFDGVSRDGAGLATLTLGFTGSDKPEEIKDQIADKFGIAIARLNKVEATIPAVINDIAAQKATVVAAIEVE